MPGESHSKALLVLSQQVLPPAGGVTVICIAVPSGGESFQLMSVCQLSIDGGLFLLFTIISISGKSTLRSK